MAHVNPDGTEYDDRIPPEMLRPGFRVRIVNDYRPVILGVSPIREGLLTFLADNIFKSKKD